MTSDPSEKTAGLLRPEDDGACEHLRGAVLPSVALTSTAGGTIDPGTLSFGWAVIYVYPRTGVPGVEMPAGWDEIPGARGCTPQSCAYRDEHDRFEELGVTVIGVSTQASDEQAEFATRVHLPFPLLSDPDLSFGSALALPTFEADGETLYRRVTLVARNGVVEHVRYPVFPPEEDASRVLELIMASDPGSAGRASTSG